MGLYTLTPLFTFGFSDLFLAGVHGCQQMHWRASQTAWGRAAKRSKVRSSSSTLLGRCFIAGGYLQLPAIHSQPEAAEQCCLVLSARQALYAVLEKCFLCWNRTKKCQTKGETLGSVWGWLGAFLMEVFSNGFAQTMGVKSLWRCQSNDLVPSMLLSPFQWCPAPAEKRDNFLNFTLCTALSPSQWSCIPSAQSNFPPEWAKRGWGWDTRG